MLGQEGTPRAGSGWSIDSLAAAVLVLLYVVLVSRGEALPYAGPARELTAPLLAIMAVGLVGWRLRAQLALLVRQPAPWQAAALAIGLAAAAGLRVALGSLDRPAAPEEAAIVTDALALMRNQEPATTGAFLALAWLHLPVAAYAYLAGVSAGLWEGIKFVTLEATLPWSRLLHLFLALLTLAVTGLAGARWATPAVGWLAAALLVVSLPSAQTATTVDAVVPGALIVAAIALLLAPLVRRVTLPPGAAGRGARVAGIVVGLVVLWLPLALAIVVAPLAAIVVAAASVTSVADLRAAPGRR